MATILAIGSIQSLFFSLILLTKKHRSLPDRILQFWLFVLFLHISANLLELKGYYEQYPHLIGSSSSLVFLYGPLLYFYAKTYVADAFKFRKVHLIHLIPFLAYNLALIPFYFQSAAFKLQYYQEPFFNDSPVTMIVFLFAKSLTIPAYTIWTLKLLRDHQKNITDHFSNLEDIDLKWLKYLVWSIAAVCAFILLSAVIKVQTNFINSFESEQYIFSAATFWVFGLGYYGLVQTPIFSSERGIKQSRINTDSQRHKSRLQPNQVEEYKHRLLEFMDQHKPYLRNKLTLKQLSEEIPMPTTELSELLNETLNQNFFQFVNSYRVEEVKQRLQDPGNKHLTILGVALECGFSSKAAFNRIFKLQTGFTPSGYLKQQKK